MNSDYNFEILGEVVERQHMNDLTIVLGPYTTAVMDDVKYLTGLAATWAPLSVVTCNMVGYKDCATYHANSYNSLGR